MNDIYGKLVRSALFPFWESRIRRRPTIERLKYVSTTESWSLDRLRAFQLTELRRLLGHAYAHVPFYRDRFREADVGPDEIRSLDDLMRIPVLTHEQARRDVTYRTAVAGAGLTIRKQTSGTTGEPMVFGYDQGSEAWRQAMKLRAYRWAGYETGARVFFFWGAPSPVRASRSQRCKTALDRALKRETYEMCHLLADDVLERTALRIARIRPRVLVCYAQAGAELARYVVRRGIRGWDDISVICGAEPLSERDRADLRRAFGPAVFNTYGCREVMLIASECEAHTGLHTSMENLIVELLVTGPDGTKRHARPGELGEVVITDLHNWTMPFIRYANGDVAVAGPREECSCGRAHLRIDSVEGRVSEMLRDARGRAVSGIAVSFLFSDLGSVVRRFQLVQRRDGSVMLRLVLNGDLATARVARLRQDCADLLAGAPVSVERVPDLPANPAGKHKLVVVER